MTHRVGAMLAALALAGCGGVETGGGTSAGDALGYLPGDAATVLLLSTDVGGEQWERLDELVFRRMMRDDGKEGETLEEAAEEAAKDAGVDWEEDVKPLLGNDLAIAVGGENLPLLGAGETSYFIAALETRGGDIEDVLRKADFKELGEAHGATLFGFEDDTTAAVEGDVVRVRGGRKDSPRGARAP